MEKYIVNLNISHLVISVIPFQEKRSRVVPALHTEHFLHYYPYSSLHQPQYSRSRDCLEVLGKEQHTPPRNNYQGAGQAATLTQRQQIQEQKRLSSASPSQTWSATVQLILRHWLKQALKLPLKSTGFGAAGTTGMHSALGETQRATSALAASSAFLRKAQPLRRALTMSCCSIMDYTPFSVATRI